jgi:hypothetical protein
MTTEQIDKLIKVGERKKLTAVQLARYVMQSPYSLSAADATTVMYAFKRKQEKPDFAAMVNASISPAMKLEANPAVSAKRTVRAWKKALKPGKFPENAGNVFRAPAENPIVRTPSILNRSAVKEFALEVSRTRKAGKFRRVSRSFVQAVEADVEAFIKDIAKRSDDIPAVCDFLNRKAIRPKVESALNEVIRKIIIRKVCANNVGKTLK